MFMYNSELSLKLQIGVFRDLYKRGLISKSQLEKCIENISHKGDKVNGTKKSSSILSG